eukprot:10663196-Heterocapsa_arctica.AAC.1
MDELLLMASVEASRASAWMEFGPKHEVPHGFRALELRAEGLLHGGLRPWGGHRQHPMGWLAEVRLRGRNPRQGS